MMNYIIWFGFLFAWAVICTVIAMAIAYLIEEIL